MSENKFDEKYFNGHTISSYEDYKTCAGCVTDMASALHHYYDDINSYVDVACAYGYMVKYFNDRGILSKGFDISKYAVEKGIEVNKVPLYNIALPNIPKYESMDLVSCSECLEHIPFEQLPASIANLFDLTDKYLFLTVGVSGTVDFAEDMTDKTHCSLLTMDSWNKLFEPYAYYRDLEAEKHFNSLPKFQSMNWAGRVFCFKK